MDLGQADQPRVGGTMELGYTLEGLKKELRKVLARGSRWDPGDVQRFMDECREKFHDSSTTASQQQEINHVLRALSVLMIVATYDESEEEMEESDDCEGDPQ